MTKPNAGPTLSIPAWGPDRTANWDCKSINRGPPFCMCLKLVVNALRNEQKEPMCKCLIIK